MAQEYIFNHLSTHDGLLSNNILSLFQSEKGYLWIGTENGLQRFDGYHFANPASSAVRRPIHQILQDKDGVVWLRMGKTIGTFDPVHFEFAEAAIDTDVGAFPVPSFTLETDAQKNVYLLVKELGCFYASKNKKTFSLSFTPFKTPAGFGVISVADDTITRRFWLNTTGGLGYVDKTSNRFYSYANNPDNNKLLANKAFTSGIAHFFIDSKRRFWIERWNDKALRMEYYCYDETRGVYTTDTAGLGMSGNGGYFDIHRFMEFGDSIVLVYGLNCMSMQENGRFVKFGPPVYSSYSIQFNVVNNVLEDKEQILWVATDDGLYNTMANINASRHLMLRQDKGRASINCLAEDDKKNIWIGTWGRGLIVLDSNLAGRPGVMRAFQKAGDENTKLTWAIHQHSITKKIWIACQAGRMLQYDAASGKIRLLRPAIFEGRTVRQIAEDHDGKLWFGLQNGKVLYGTPGEKGDYDMQFHEMHHFDGFISRMVIDKKNNLWVAVANDGVYELDTRNGNYRKAYTANEVTDILAISDSIYLFAAEHLARLNVRTGKIDHLAFYNKMPLGKVLTLQPGLQNDCWLSTSNGMYRYNILTGDLIKYSQWDGLITVFNNSFLMESSAKLKNNKLMFGGNQNFVLFDPARYIGTADIPPVQITDIQLFNNYLPVDSILERSSLKLKYNENSLAIHFASLSFTRLEKLTYEYKLQGVDKEWVQVKIPVPVRYPLIPPGHYLFQVRSKDSEGRYASTTTTLPIDIQPPFWGTYWFYGLIGIAVAAFLFYLHRLRLERLLHIERVRSKLARDLHDDMGSTLSTINILSNIVLRQPDLDGNTGKEFMRKINDSTVQMMESMDDIIWSINPLNDSMAKVLSRMKQVAGNVLEPKGIETVFKAEEAVKHLVFTMEWRREIFLIYKEAVNNIVKYADCSTVVVTLCEQASLFVLTIRDDGQGFDPAKNNFSSPTRGNGFINMGKRAEVMKGDLSIDALPGKGTQITLRIPIA